MKTTVVPAQVTTVEDKIAGNLSFTQLLLLTTPVFMSGAIFTLLPPFMGFSAFKLGLCAILFIVCGILAIRIRGDIILHWLMIVVRYNLRPRYFLYDKNSSYLRSTKKTKQATQAVSGPEKVEKQNKAIDEPLSIKELLRVKEILSDSRSLFHFKTTKKGELRVFIKEIE